MTATNTWNLYNGLHEQTSVQTETINISEQTLNHRLDHFLKSEQNKAYAIVMLNLKNSADAMDVIQNAMLSFVSHYKNKPQSQWKPLFYRILQNKIKDHFRKQSSWLRVFFSPTNEDDGQAKDIENSASDLPSPLAQLHTNSRGKALVKVIQSLPTKQKQAVVYRLWQQFSVSETAQIMNISQGSVKTHLFRATKKIKAELGNSNE